MRQPSDLTRARIQRAFTIIIGGLAMYIYFTQFGPIIDGLR
jgi:hypothetical protein